MKKKVFLDTNVFIDYLGSRNDYAAASMIISLAQKGYFDLLVSSLSFATASYILNAHHKRTNDDIVAMFATFVKKCNVTPVDSIVISNAIASGFSDFEDAMQYYTAIKAKANIIITRNGKDFAASKLPVMTAAEYIATLE
jgi:predicted nucleic acid-binding protein